MRSDSISVHNLPGCNAAAVFTTSSNSVFREQGDILPQSIGKKKYMPWGVNNQMPYDVLDLIEKDETLDTCLAFTAETLYGAGLTYDTKEADRKTVAEVEVFQENNDLVAGFMGACLDFKHFGWTVHVILLNADNSRIVRVVRKETCYCRFSPAKNGRIRYVHFAQWRDRTPLENEIETVELLDPAAPLADLRRRIKDKPRVHKYAVLSSIPTVDHTYYPIPTYASLFRGKWYNIKQLIGAAKEATLKNSAPIKYHIEVSKRYWESILRAEKITDRAEQMARLAKEKENIIDFLTGAENSGKVLFSEFYISPDGKPQHDVVITRIESGTKQGGDWETDIQEAINMICFATRVHSNLVGSVPGKSQSNNSGSDKRELYTIAQALQKPYRDILLNVHRLAMRFNGWRGVTPKCPFVMLTTLDEHADAKTITQK